MKKLRLLTVSTMLLAGGLATFTSCGGGEKDGEKTEENASKDNGFAVVKQMMDAIDGGKLEMGASSADDVRKVMDIEDGDDDYITLDKNFDGYSFDVNFSMEDEVLNSISCNTFYDDDKKKEAKKDSEEILEYLKKLLGEPDSDSNKFYDWSYGDYEISFNIFEDGYSIYIDPPYEDYDDDYSDDENCVGDFYNLKKDLKDLFLANVKNGSIKLGSTTKSQMATMTGDGDGFDKEYDGLSVSGYYSYDGDVLSSITLDYFYDCEGAMSLLDMDKEDITEVINEALGVTGEKDGDYEDAGIDWSINGMNVRQANFSDGYGVYFEK